MNYDLMRDMIEWLQREPQRMKPEFWLTFDPHWPDSYPGDRSIGVSMNFIRSGLLPDKTHEYLVGCAAGLAMLLRPKEAEEFRKSYRLPSAFWSENYVADFFTNLGAVLYGLTFVQANALFSHDLWPAPYLYMKDADGAIAMLERMIDKQSADFLAAYYEDDDEGDGDVYDN